ncbi:MAG: hypothetical protein AB7V14_01120 [Kiritimatiellia bacterium]
MITKIYWATRIAGYGICLVGIFFFLAHQADADPALRNMGAGIVGIGFVSFFVSYAIRFWLRFGLGRNSGEEKP